MDWQKKGAIRMVGIVEEQYPDRARLFMQWHQMGWPVLVDSLNLLDVPYVPITLALDEEGIIRKILPPLMLASASEKPEGLEKEFLSRSSQGPAGVPESTPVEPDLKELRSAAKDGSAENQRALADALLMWGEPQKLGRAMKAYQRALESAAIHGPTHFRLGVAYRKRYDSDYRRSGDFQNAVDRWRRALEIDPNNYIWRRRIQQYGPRLDKPYAFYDWVRTAREAIIARGESPVSLITEPSRSELAEPLKQLEETSLAEKEPDPKGQVNRDKQHFVTVETTAVPSVLTPGSSSRIYVVLRPNIQMKAHWNNEVEDLLLWLDPPAECTVGGRMLSVPNPPETVSQEVRQVEVELECSDKAHPGPVHVPAYALYYVCEDINGTCLFRRQDVPIRLQLISPQDGN